MNTNSSSQAENPIIETDLIEEEKAIILRGREENSKGGYVPLDSII
ncbi:MAG: hypothetical protein FWC09_10245 [Lachnospiraceae bacterium]|nr:hypothetical protein [Lachnospiraceae bacterium]